MFKIHGSQTYSLRDLEPHLAVKRHWMLKMQTVTHAGVSAISAPTSSAQMLVHEWGISRAIPVEKEVVQNFQ